MAKGIEVEAARREILARVRPLGVEEVGLAAALGRRLGVAAVAEAPVQGFDNSSMDGYAVRAIDTRGLQAVVPGGDARQASGRGTALFVESAISWAAARPVRTPRRQSTLCWPNRSVPGTSRPGSRSSSCG